MITRPQALLREYSEFIPAEIDYLNVLRAYEAVDRSGGWGRRLLPTKLIVSLDLGPLASVAQTILTISGTNIPLPQIEAQWNLIEPKVREDLDEEEQYQRARKLHKRCLRRGVYFHNVEQHQKLSKEDAALLKCLSSSAVPLTKRQLEHGDLFVIDALLLLPKTNGSEGVACLCDYPPLLQKGSDTTIPLRISDEVKKRLSERSDLALGWHPYCRILGRYVSLSIGEGFKYVVEPLLISLRYFEQPPDRVVERLEKEWKPLGDALNSELNRRERVVDAFNEDEFMYFEKSDPIHEKWRDVQRKAQDDADAKYLLEHVEDTRTFEDDIFSGPLGFLVGLYYFLCTDGQKRFGAQGRQIADLMRYSLPDENRWRRNLKYLEPRDVLRFDEQRLNKILSAVKGPDAA